MKKTDVETHNIGYGRPHYPAINIKVYHFAPGLSAEELECDEETYEKACEFAFESICMEFWEDVRNEVCNILGKGMQVYATGRSGGWLVVVGLPPISSWDAIALAKWARLEKFCKNTIDYLSSKEYIKDMILANRWNESGAEQYNFVEAGNGANACMVDIKKVEKAARDAYLKERAQA